VREPASDAGHAALMDKRTRNSILIVNYRHFQVTQCQPVSVGQETGSVTVSGRVLINWHTAALEKIS